jgi:hypothetical protein
MNLAAIHTVVAARDDLNKMKATGRARLPA